MREVLSCDHPFLASRWLTATTYLPRSFQHSGVMTTVSGFGSSSGGRTA